MAKDSLQIGTEKDTYLTTGLWTMLSSWLSQKGNKSLENQICHSFKKPNLKDRRNADVN